MGTKKSPKLRFGLRSLLNVIAFVACAMMAVRTWWVESQHLGPAAFPVGSYVLRDGEPCVVRSFSTSSESPGWQYHIEGPSADWMDYVNENELQSSWNAEDAFQKQAVKLELAQRESAERAKRDRLARPRDVGETGLAFYDSRENDQPTVKLHEAVTVDRTFLMKHIVLNAHAPPRRLVRVRTEQPSVFVCGHAIHESYAITWVDIDSGEDVLAPGFHDETLGTVDVPFDHNRSWFSLLEVEGGISAQLAYCAFDGSTEALLAWFLDALGNR